MPEVAAPRFDTEARFAQYEERVVGIDRRLTSLDQATSAGFAQVTAQISSLASELRAGQRVPWVAIGTLFTAVWGVVLVIGWLAYMPLQTGLAELKTASLEQIKVVAATQLETAKAFADLPKQYLSNDMAQILRDLNTDKYKDVIRQLAELSEKASADAVAIARLESSKN